MIHLTSFGLGLGLGLAGLGLYHWRFTAKLRRIVGYIQPEWVGWSLPATVNLTGAIAQQMRQQTHAQQQVVTWRSVVYHAPIGFLWVDEDHQLLWCNPTAQRLLHLDLTEVSWEATPPRLLLEWVRSYELDELIEETRQNGTLCQRDWTFHPALADSSSVFRPSAHPLRGYGLPLPDHQVGIFLVDRQETVLLTQQRDRWISDVAHELKTPLTSIRLVAEMLQTRVADPWRSWVDRLLNETIRLSQLVHDLLELSRMESFSTLLSDPRTEHPLVSLVSVIQSAWNALEPLSGSKHVQVDYQGPEIVWLPGDGPRFHRLFFNLFDNSIRYSPPDTTIQVQVRLEPGTQQVLIDLIDQGPGFLDLDLPYIFDRFYRGDQSRARPASVSQPLHVSTGSGLGLAIVRQIVEAHSGRVEAMNHPHTGGAWIRIELPLGESNPSVTPSVTS